MTRACCKVVELRRYTLHPGRRDELIELFDGHLVEPQEELGMHVTGQFREAGADEAFVWLRGFTSMATRRRGLEGFYGGTCWRRHRYAANATMVDSEDVHLLEPVHLAPAWPSMGDPRVGSDAVLELTLHPVADGAPPLAHTYAEVVRPVLDELGSPPLAVLTTLDAVNDFPALPVHAHRVLVWLLRFADQRDRDEHGRAREGSRRWSEVQALLRDRGVEAPVLRELRPTSRSQLS